MTLSEFEDGLVKVAKIQADAGWSERSIELYADEMRAISLCSLDAVLMVGAGLACDNSRFGVPS